MAWQLPAQINVSVILCLDLACLNHLALSGSVFEKQSLSQGAKSCQDRLTNFISALLTAMELCFPMVPLLKSTLQLKACGYQAVLEGSEWATCWLSWDP